MRILKEAPVPEKKPEVEREHVCRICKRTIGYFASDVKLGRMGAYNYGYHIYCPGCGSLNEVPKPQ